MAPLKLPKKADLQYQNNTVNYSGKISTQMHFIGDKSPFGRTKRQNDRPVATRRSHWLHILRDLRKSPQKWNMECWFRLNVVSNRSLQFEFTADFQTTSSCWRKRMPNYLNWPSLHFHDNRSTLSDDCRYNQGHKSKVTVINTPSLNSINVQEPHPHPRSRTAN